MSIVLRPYQNEALDQLNDYWTEGVRPLVVAPTGSGKSILIAEFLRREFEAHPELQAIVATHSQELVRQNREEFEGLAPALKASMWLAPDHSQGALRHARRYILRAGGQARSVDEVLDECDSWTLPTHLTVEEGQWYYHVKKIHFEGERI